MKRTKKKISGAVCVRTGNGQLSARAISVALNQLSSWLNERGVDVNVSCEKLHSSGKIGFMASYGGDHAKTH